MSMAVAWSSRQLKALGVDCTAIGKGHQESMEGVGEECGKCGSRESEGSRWGGEAPERTSSVWNATEEVAEAIEANICGV